MFKSWCDFWAAMNMGPGPHQPFLVDAGKMLLAFFVTAGLMAALWFFVAGSDLESTAVTFGALLAALVLGLGLRYLIFYRSPPK